MATRLRWLVWPVIIVASVMAVVVMLITLSTVPEADAQNATRTQKGSEVSAQSLTPKASFASGTGATRFAVRVSNHGNLSSFESPAGTEAVSAGREGYAVCSFSSAGGDVVHGHDTGDVEAGFGRPTIVQPNPGAFPLTVTRNTTDGKFQLKQVWNKPDAAEKDITVTMTLKNRSNATIRSVALSRSGDYDVGTSGAEDGLLTDDTVMLWEDLNTPVASPPVAVRMTALSFGTSHFQYLETRFNWAEEGTLSTRRACYGMSEETPAPEVNYAMRVAYGFDSISAGASKTVKFVIGRM